MTRVEESEQFQYAIQIATSRAKNAPRYKLHSPAGVVTATLFTSPIGGSIVIAVNYWHLRRPLAAVITFVITTVSTMVILAGLFTVVFALKVVPPRLITIPLSLAMSAAMYGVASWLQGDYIEEHRAQVGMVAATWRSGLLGLVAFPVLIFGIFAAETLIRLGAASTERVTSDGMAAACEGLGRSELVIEHASRFLELAPDSPLASEAEDMIALAREDLSQAEESR